MPHANLKLINRLASIVIMVLLGPPVFAQRLLTNDDVVAMVKAGIAESVIIAKIRNSATRFETSTTSLSDLTNQGVPNSVIAEIIEAEGRLFRENRGTAKGADILDITLEQPENGTLSDLGELDKVYFYTEDPTARSILEGQIKKYPRFTVVDAWDKADFVIAFGITGQALTYWIGGVTDITSGSLYVLKLGERDAAGKTHVRILYSVSKTKDYVLDAHPAKSTIQKFIKDLRKSRKEK